MRRVVLFILAAWMIIAAGWSGEAQAQQANRVAQLTVDAAGVEIRRVNTDAWIPIRVESIVGVGDGIRTKAGGRASLRFFDGQIKVQIQPETEVKLDAFQGLLASFKIALSISKGFLRQSVGTSITKDNAKSFQLVTPAFSAYLLEGDSDTRVEVDSRSSVFTSSNGRLSVEGAKGVSSTVGRGEGVRAVPNEVISEVVPARSFASLDIALDGCPSSIALDNDVRLNVRLGAARSFQRIGGLDDKANLQVMGVAISGGWYRIRYRGGFGWIEVLKLPLPANCTDLRVFADKFGPENSAFYQDLSDVIKIEATPAATPGK